MQLAQPRTEKEQKRAEKVAKKEAGTESVWLGGSFNAKKDQWEWADGTPIENWPSEPLDGSDAEEDGKNLCMYCSKETPEAGCLWVACGGAKAESHSALCESQIEP